MGGRHAPFRDAQPVGLVPEKAEEAAAGSAWVPALDGRAGWPPGIAGIAGGR